MEVVISRDGLLAETAVLLGCMLIENELKPAGVSRASKARDLWRAGHVRRIICSGGFTGGTRSEAAALRAWLSSESIPEDSILLEERSQDTIGNALFTAKMLETVPEALVVVSTGSHLRRAIALFEHMLPGCEIMGVPADDVLVDAAFSDLENHVLTGFEPGDLDALESYISVHGVQRG